MFVLFIQCKNCMATSESKGRFFYKTNRFESIRITNRIEEIRIDSNRELECSIAKLVLGSFDRNIFRHQNRQLNEHKYFFLHIFHNHRCINSIPCCALFCFLKSGNSLNPVFNPVGNLVPSVFKFYHFLFVIARTVCSFYVVFMFKELFRTDGCISSLNIKTDEVILYVVW